MFGDVFILFSSLGLDLDELKPECAIFKLATTSDDIETCGFEPLPLPVCLSSLDFG